MNEPTVPDVGDVGPEDTTDRLKKLKFTDEQIAYALRQVTSMKQS